MHDHSGSTVVKELGSNPLGVGVDAAIVNAVHNPLILCNGISTRSLKSSEGRSMMRATLSEA